MLDIKNWQSIPCMQNAVATEEDVNAGKAAFYVPGGSENIKGKTGDIQLPKPAITKDTEEAIIIIQHEVVDDNQTIGFRNLDGSYGICLLEELTLLDEPNQSFYKQNVS